ncbi:MAG: M13 family metallopeptidase, partial [Oscillospiraceae bacterium]|nr:M13 family metallopeptidase [Oscillospiraceae bacterium]
ETEAAEAPAEEAAAPAEEAAEDAPDYTTGTPWPDVDLEGVVTPDTPAELKDNFVLYVNKDKILELEIPEGYPYGGTVMDLVLANAEDTKNMFLGDAPESHDAKLAYDLFWLMMDWDSRNELGVAPLKEMTDAVEAISSVDELLAYSVETPIEKQLGSLWGAGAMQDLIDSSRYVLVVADTGLLLGDSAEYRELTSFGALKKEAYSALAEKMLLKLGYSQEEAAQKIDNCFAFETLLADVIPTSEEKQRPDYYGRIYNPYSREDLEAAQGALPILAGLEQAQGYPAAEEYIVMNPAYLEKLNEVCTEENLPLIRDMLIVNGVIGQAGSLDRECYEWRVECNNAISGATGIRDDETVFSSSVSNTLSWPVAQLYTATYLKQEDKDRISAMIDDILDAYHGILAEADFFSDATRAKAIEKLDAIGKCVLYPDSWEKYSFEDLNFKSREEGGTLWEASEAIAKFALAQSVEDYSKPVDKEKWGQPPQEVNCFYNPQVNNIYIMGAFARGGIYRSDMSDEELYATIGSVIGHEISHAFDSTGAQFDKNGDMISWWTEADYAAFLERNAKMEAYYNAMHPWEGQDFYGSIMTGEACADMAGLKVMLRLAAEKPDFDYDLFFRSYAGVWLTKDTLGSAYSRINDSHPMGYLRVNATLQQYDEFLDFYSITEGDGMYLAPEDRVAIW